MYVIHELVCYIMWKSRTITIPSINDGIAWFDLQNWYYWWFSILRLWKRLKHGPSLHSGTLHARHPYIDLHALKLAPWLGSISPKMRRFLAALANPAKWHPRQSPVLLRCTLLCSGASLPWLSLVSGLSSAIWSPDSGLGDWRHFFSSASKLLFQESWRYRSVLNPACVFQLKTAYMNY